jgi:hypothetical protein
LPWLPVDIDKVHWHGIHAVAGIQAKADAVAVNREPDDTLLPRAFHKMLDRDVFIHFFEAARVATISGFLANPEYGGNAGKAGWRAIGFDDRFVWAEPFGWYDGEGAAGE